MYEIGFIKSFSQVNYLSVTFEGHISDSVSFLLLARIRFFRGLDEIVARRRLLRELFN
jgi:hypothetical protein